jgi:hypothetical protein
MAGYVRGKYNSRNLYAQRRTGIQTTTRDRVSNSRENSSFRPSNKANNIYTDRDGNIFQRDNNGNWNRQNQRPATRPASNITQPAARPATPATRPAQPVQRPSVQPATRPAAPSNQLQNYYQNRSRGTANYQNFQRNQPSPAGMRIRSAGRLRR